MDVKERIKLLKDNYKKFYHRNLTDIVLKECCLTIMRDTNIKYVKDNLTLDQVEEILKHFSKGKK